MRQQPKARASKPTGKQPQQTPKTPKEEQRPYDVKVTISEAAQYAFEETRKK